MPSECTSTEVLCDSVSEGNVVVGAVVKRSRAASARIRSRNWCFTTNNPNARDIERVKDLVCVYVCIGLEKGDSGTEHLQGYVTFENARSFSTVKELLPPGSHIEKAVSTARVNREYCKKCRSDDPPELENKGDKWYECGKLPLCPRQKGALNSERWEAARALAREGRFEEVPSDIYWKYYRTMKEIYKDHMKLPEALDGVCGQWFHGPAGSGKTRFAMQEYPEAYLKMCNKWWDGYQAEPVVILDDLDPHHDCLRHHLKKWADLYPFLGENKGGAIAVRPKVFVVTSQYAIDEIFRLKDGSPDEKTIAAIRRRFQVTKFAFGPFNPFGLMGSSKEVV